MRQKNKLPLAFGVKSRIFAVICARGHSDLQMGSHLPLALAQRAGYCMRGVRGTAWR